MLWRLGRSKDGSGAHVTENMLDFGIQYSVSDQAEYLSKGSVAIVEDKAVYRSYVSAVHMLAIHFGWVMHF